MNVDPLSCAACGKQGVTVSIYGVSLCTECGNAATSRSAAVDETVRGSVIDFIQSVTKRPIVAPTSPKE